MSDEKVLNTLTDIRNWIRAAAYPSVKRLLEEALPDEKSRKAYQMCDGTNNRDVICRICKIGKNTLPALQARCVALGLMNDNEGRKTRLFNLTDFGLLFGEGALGVEESRE